MRIALASCANLPSWEVDDRPLFRAFASLGVETSSPAWDDASIQWNAFDAVLIRTTWDYMEKRDDYVAWAKRVESQTRLFNPAKVVEWNTRKTYLRELECQGVHIAPTRWLDRASSHDVASIMRAHGWTRGFIKPVIGATARETLRFDADADGLAAAQSHLDRMLAREDMMLQRYLSRVETEGERSVIFIAGEVSHAVQKIPVAGDYRVQDDFGAKDFPITLTDEQRCIASDAVAAARSILNVDLLYARCDFLIDDEGRWTLTELELVEPSMFFRHDSHAAKRLAWAMHLACKR